MTTQEKATQLVERYVREVGGGLPRKIRSDVEDELRTLLQEALDERALAAGRAPDEEMAVEVLRKFGRPEEVAQRYQPGPRYLIGPRLYPTFVLTSKIVLAVLAGLALVGLALGVVFRPERMDLRLSPLGILQLLGWTVQVLFINVALIATAFAILERVQARQGKLAEPEEEEWDPRDLPAADDPERISVAGRVAAIYCIVALFVLFNFFPEYVGIYFFSKSSVYTLSLAELGLRIPLVLLNFWWVLALVLNVVLVRRGHWGFETRLAEFGLGLFAAFLLYWIIATSGPVAIDTSWLAGRGWAESAGAMKVAEKVAPLLGKIIRGSLILILLITLGEAAQRAWRLATRYRSSWSALVNSSVW